MKTKLFAGIDIGGTKISGAIVETSGKVLFRQKLKTPPNAPPKIIVEIIRNFISDFYNFSKPAKVAVCGLGVAVPGIVRDATGKIVVTPNLRLSGFEMKQVLEKELKIPVAVGNDVNLGALGELWLGAAKGYKNAINIFCGTGIGGGIIINHKIYSGVHGAAAEIGHMIVDPNGNECTCGNRGCLESIAGRWAIESEIRKGVRRRKKNIIQSLTKGNLNQIKSGMLREALLRKDPLVTSIITNVSEMLGTACISLRHLIDPEIFVFGGGVIEACGDFMLPIIFKKFQKDPFFSKLPACKIVPSKLTDEAVYLGGIILIQQKMGLPPITTLISPQILLTDNNRRIQIKGTSFDNSIVIRADGKVKKRKKKLAVALFDDARKIGAEELKTICKKNPNFLIVASGKKKNFILTKDGRAFLKKEKITLKQVGLREGVRQFNQISERKAAIFQMKS